MSSNQQHGKRFQIFRGDETQDLMETDLMAVNPSDETQQKGIKKLMEAGYGEGDHTKVLINVPGFSLIYAWFKKAYPLLRHAHDSDCLYYVIAGSLQMGTETLGPRDGFFIKAGTPYTYTPGPEGVEVLEFRHVSKFDFTNLSKNEVFYDKALETVAANIEDWRKAKRPSETA